MKSNPLFYYRENLIRKISDKVRTAHKKEKNVLVLLFKYFIITCAILLLTAIYLP